MIAIAAFTAQELVVKQEIFEHLALRLEKEVILELDDIERDVGIKNVSCLLLRRALSARQAGELLPCCWCPVARLSRVVCIMSAASWQPGTV